MLPPTSSVPGGWYPDPENEGTERYWDGWAWSEQRRPAQGYELVAPVVLRAPLQQSPSNPQAVTALSCGASASVFGAIPFTFWIAFPLGIIAIIFGALGRSKAQREPLAGKRSMATWGLGLGVAGLVLGLVGLILVLTVFEGDNGRTALEEIQRCIDNPDLAGC